MDDLLKTFGLDYEQLDTPGHTGERETLQLWLENLKTNELTLTKVQEYIGKLRDNVARELVRTPETEVAWLFFRRPNPKALLLKARLHNYLELEAFLIGPEQAKAALEQRLSTFKSKVQY